MCARPRHPLGSAAASGKTKDEYVFALHKSGQKVKPYGKPSGPITFPQFLQRYSIKARLAAWQALSASQKEAWNTEAEYLGDPWSGYTLFISRYIMPLPAVQAGDLAYGNSVPAWARMGIGSEDDLLSAVSGFPTWRPLQEKAVQFYDDFADASRHWSWYDHNLSAAKTIVESGSVLTLACTNGTNCDWWTGSNNAPKAIIGIPGFPCEIITKLNSYAVNDPTLVGLFIGRNPTGAGTSADSTVFITHAKSGSVENIILQSIGGTVNLSAAVATLPIWFRIRIGLDSEHIAKADFSYSTNGTAWTVLYTSTSYPTGNAGYGLVTGLFIKNYAAAPAISAPFEFFKILRSFGPG